MATRKLDKSDLEQLNTLQESYQQVTSQIATCTIDEELLSDQIETIQKEKRFQMRQFKDLQQQESDLISSLKQKYGDGEINLTEGIFISQD
jgi:ethanolamine utilization protein EutQ (cupin superfamily)